jgi:enamine deaminase RidA (YjgF/YER057c/UK114 family)
MRAHAYKEETAARISPTQITSENTQKRIGSQNLAGHLMKIESVDPAGWARPKGYSNAIQVRGAQSFLFVSGQIAWDAKQQLVGRGDLPAQFAQALRNVVAVVKTAGGWPEHIVRMTVYVTDKKQYLAHTKEIGAAWREIIGKHYPAMSLVQVADLLEPGALIEIEATAAMP